MSGSDVSSRSVSGQSQFIDHQHPYYLVDYLIPRPDDTELQAMQLKYYEAASSGFDDFNEQQSVLGFLGTINQFVASELKEQKDLSCLLSIAAGTGARERLIRQMAGCQFDITVCDLSPSMCSQAEALGMETICGAWEDIDYEPETLFDACMFIFSFECIVSYERRLEALAKVNRSLRVNAPIFLDIANVHDKNGLGPEVARRFHALGLARHDYDLGDLFYRRDDIPDTICFCHYSSKQEMKELFHSAGFVVEKLLFLDEVGKVLNPSEDGTMLFKAVKVKDVD